MVQDMKLSDVAEILLESLEQEIEEGQTSEFVRVFLNTSNTVNSKISLVNYLRVVVMEAERGVLIT